MSRFADRSAAGVRAGDPVAGTRIMNALNCALSDARRENGGIASCLHLDTDILYAGIFPFSDIQSLSDNETNRKDRLLIGTLWSQGVLGTCSVLPFHSEELKRKLIKVQTGGGVAVNEIEDHIWGILGQEKSNSLKELTETIKTADPDAEPDQTEEQARLIRKQLVEIGPEAFLLLDALSLRPRDRVRRAVQYIRPSVAETSVVEWVSVIAEARILNLLEQERSDDRDVQSKADARALASLIGSWHYALRRPRVIATPLFVTGSPSVQRVLERAPDAFEDDKHGLARIWQIDDPNGPFRSLDYLLIRTMYRAIAFKTTQAQWHEGPSMDDLERFGEYIIHLHEFKIDQKEHSVVRFLDHILERDFVKVQRSEACRHLVFGNELGMRESHSVGPCNIQMRLRENPALRESVNNQLSKETRKHLGHLRQVFHHTIRTFDLGHELQKRRSTLHYRMSTQDLAQGIQIHDRDKYEWALCELGLACYHPHTIKSQSTRDLLQAVAELILSDQDSDVLASASEQIALRALSLDRPRVEDRILCGVCEYFGLWPEAFHFEFLAHSYNRVLFDSELYWYVISRMQDEPLNADIMRQVCGIQNENDRHSIVIRVLEEDDAIDIRASELARMLQFLWIHRKQSADELRDAAVPLLEAASRIIHDRSYAWASRLELAMRCSLLGLMSSNAKTAVEYARAAGSLLNPEKNDNIVRAMTHSRLAATVRAVQFVDDAKLEAIFEWRKNPNSLHPLDVAYQDTIREKLDGGLLNSRDQIANSAIDPASVVSRIFCVPKNS